jgi:hypothetical protein
MAWAGIVGKLFKTAKEFETHVAGLEWSLWRPRFVVVHNTSTPDLALWDKWKAKGTPKPEQWAKNLVGYYRDDQHWSSGPHLFVTPDGILAFTPLTVHGTHSPSWNSISWGVETVGEFQSEAFKGPVRDHLISALATLHAAAGLQLLPYARGVRGLHFHKEDPATTHKTCPGKNMSKATLVKDVQEEIDRRHGGEHVPGGAGG